MLMRKVAAHSPEALSNIMATTSALLSPMAVKPAEMCIELPARASRRKRMCMVLTASVVSEAGANRRGSPARPNSMATASMQRAT
jgi:hypothetical protein